MKEQVLVGVSGGVDSSVCVQLLQEAGFAVRGAVIRFSPAHDHAVEEARALAGQLGIPLEVLDAQDRFQQAVVRPFCESYCAGRTPNPCVVCNPLVKFDALCAAADRAGIERIATGHYARLSQREGALYVRRAASEKRDQSYMLYRLGQPVLRRLLLPLGEMEKEDVRATAAQRGLSSAKTPDSQEICFIPDGDYAAYIRRAGFTAPEGRFIGPEGQDLGPHRGLLHYTVGQRRGLHIALGRPVFVRRICPDGNIQLGYAEDAFFTGVRLGEVFRGDGRPFPPEGRYEVKIRSAAKPAPCTARALPDGELELQFDQPARAPAPCQAAVLYEGDLVVGGGVIEEASPL